MKWWAGLKFRLKDLLIIGYELTDKQIECGHYMKYNFKDLVDIPKLQELTDELYMAAYSGRNPLIL